MLYAAIDIHKHAFQAAVLYPESGEVVEERFSADRESLGRWAERWRGRVESVAIEATTGWRWVWRELAGEGFDVRLAEPVQTRALLGRRRGAKTDRLDARWLARLLAKEMLPQSWIPPAQIQELRKARTPETCASPMAARKAARRCGCSRWHQRRRTIRTKRTRPRGRPPRDKHSP
ncbi:MAG: IS110 family transposase [Gaiellaceae bacterium]